MVGCAGAPSGTVRVLGDVDYRQAFDAAQSTLSQFSFSVMEADPTTGTILSRPTYVHSEPQGLLGDAPTRKVARMKITQGPDGVTARLAIEVQQEVTQIYPSGTDTGLSTTYSGVPNDTPAQGAGAATRDQNTAWRFARHDRALEMAILDDLAQMLTPPEETTQPEE